MYWLHSRQYEHLRIARVLLVLLYSRVETLANGWGIEFFVYFDIFINIVLLFSLRNTRRRSSGVLMGGMRCSDRGRWVSTANQWHQLNDILKSHVRLFKKKQHVNEERKRWKDEKKRIKKNKKNTHDCPEIRIKDWRDWVSLPST